MASLQAYRFRAQMPKIALMQFLANAPLGYYVFIAPPGSEVFGLLLGDEITEYLCNECVPTELTMIAASELEAARRIPGARIWGEPALLDA